MKVKILTAALLAAILGTVAVNTLFLTRRIDRTVREVEALHIEDEDAAMRAKEIYADFEKDEEYLSLTVNHNDLCEVGGLFIETIAYLTVKNAEEASVAKSRLIDALLHLRRLSGINVDSIF